MPGQAQKGVRLRGTITREGMGKRARTSLSKDSIGKTQGIGEKGLFRPIKTICVPKKDFYINKG